MVKSMIAQPVELKYFDQVQVIGATAVGNIYNQSDITRGSDVTQRVGNQVTIKSVDLRCSAKLSPNVDYAAIRFLLLVDKQGYNTPTVADVLEPAQLNTTYTDIIPYHWDYRKRFKILHDEVIQLVKYSTAYSYRHVVDKLNLTSYNIGASTTFSNQIYILIIGAETNILNLSTFQWFCRIEYTDE